MRDFIAAIITAFLNLIFRPAPHDDSKPVATGIRINDAISRAPEPALDAIVYDDADKYRDGG